MNKKNGFILTENEYYFVRPIEENVSKSNRIAQFKQEKFFFCGIAEGVDIEFFQITGYCELSND